MTLLKVRFIIQYYCSIFFLVLQTMPHNSRATFKRRLSKKNFCGSSVRIFCKTSYGTSHERKLYTAILQWVGVYRSSRRNHSMGNRRPSTNIWSGQSELPEQVTCGRNNVPSIIKCHFNVNEKSLTYFGQYSGLEMFVQVPDCCSHWTQNMSGTL